MEKILIVDDEQDILRALEIYLRTEGYEVLTASSGKEALRIMETEDVHLVLMDIMMPEMDGIEATVELRKNNNIPVILLTAKGEDTDKVLGLNIGADDYVTKPFNPVELIARVKAQLRRYMHLGSLEKTESLLQTGPLLLDDRKKKVTLEGEEINLTPREYNILKTLMEHKGQVLSSDDIYKHMGMSSYGVDNALAVHIRHLREKIEIDPSSPRYIKVVWGQGYTLEE